MLHIQYFFRSFFPFSLHSSNLLQYQALRHITRLGFWSMGSDPSVSTPHNVAFMEFLEASKPQFPHPKMGLMIVPTS